MSPGYARRHQDGEQCSLILIKLRPYKPSDLGQQAFSGDGIFHVVSNGRPR